MATMVRQIDAEIENLQYEFITPTKVMVKGEIAKQIFYVSNTDLVRHQKVRTPFTVSFEVIGLQPGSEVVVNATVEHISHRLITNGTQVEESILVKIMVNPTIGGIGVSQQFLIRNIDTLDEPQAAAQPAPAPHPSTEEPQPDSTMLPVPDKEELMPAPSYPMTWEEKLRQLEEQIRSEVERSLRWELRSQMEHELQLRLDEERRLREEAARQAELERQAEVNRRYQAIQRESVRQSMYGFKTKY